MLFVTFVSLAYYRHAHNPQEQQIKKGTSLEGNKKHPQQEPVWSTIKAIDGVDLAYAAYVPSCPEAALIFCHGNGAHSGAGYTYMAEQLSKNHNIATYLFDRRGHGRSGGPRGHTPTDCHIWQDVRTAYEFTQQTHPNIPVFLGGHSAGAGVLLNYADWTDHKDPAGYLLVTPFLGKDVDIFREREKKSERSFATIHYWSLLVHYLTGGLIGGNWRAMTMDFPEHLITKQGFVDTYTVNMINALNTRAPLATLQKMQVPTYIFIAEKDELFDPCKLDQVLSNVVTANSLIKTEHLPDAKHLTVLGEIDDHIGKVIHALDSE